MRLHQRGGLSGAKVCYSHRLYIRKVTPRGYYRKIHQGGTDFESFHNTFPNQRMRATVLFCVVILRVYFSIIKTKLKVE